MSSPKHRMRTRRQRHDRFAAWLREYNATQPPKSYRLEDLVARVPESLRRIEELKARVAPELWARANAPGAWKYAGMTGRRPRDGARALYNARMGAERQAYWERELWWKPQKDGTRRING